MEKTLEELIEKIQASIDNPDVEYIGGIREENSNSYPTTFFGLHKIKIYRVRKGFNEVVTEFGKTEYIEPILNFLNSNPKALAKLKDGKDGKFIVFKGWQSNIEFNADIELTIDTKKQNYYIMRLDTRGSYTFNSLNELISEVFSEEENKWTPFKPAIARAIRKKTITQEREVKASETRLENAKAKLEDIKVIFDKMPDEYKLLVELENMTK